MTSYGTNGLQCQDNPGRGFAMPASTTFNQYVLLKLVNFVLTLCAKDANRDWIGVSTEPRSSGVIPVRFPQAGSMPCTTSASETINPGNVVYKAANGCVGLSSTGSIAVGIALTFATGAGQYIEVLPYA